MILSVSRRTDIPSYYSQWFFNRLQEGFLYVKNPMNPHQISQIDLSPDTIDGMVFWTKNPEPMIPRLELLKHIPYYFQFTLTGYGKDVEPGIPDKPSHMIPVFQKLSTRIGAERMVWRYDPIFLNHRYSQEYHLNAFGEIAKNLQGYTDTVVISFLDFYEKTVRNMASLHLEAFSDTAMYRLAEEMARIAAVNQMTITSCAERIDLESVGVVHGSCIDKKRMEQVTGAVFKDIKDTNQRRACQCLASVEVGTYHTCQNGCLYCYANQNAQRVQENYRIYDPHSPLLCGTIDPEDRVTKRLTKSLKESQLTLPFFG